MAARSECCEAMALQLNWKCEQHSDPFDCADVLVYYSEERDQYGIVIHDGALVIRLLSTVHGAARGSRKLTRRKTSDTLSYPIGHQIRLAPRE